MSSSNYPLHCSMNLCKCTYFFSAAHSGCSATKYATCIFSMQWSTTDINTFLWFYCCINLPWKNPNIKYILNFKKKVTFFSYNLIKILFRLDLTLDLKDWKLNGLKNGPETGLETGLDTWDTKLCSIPKLTWIMTWDNANHFLCCLIRNKAWDKIQK